MGAVVSAAGCVTSGEEALHHPLIPDKSLYLSSSTSIPVESLIGAALVFVVIDPLAPNWRIESRPLPDRRYAVGLMMKRFTTGGEGEAHGILVREAERLAREQDAHYRITAYSEGIESQTLAARRIAQGVVELY